MFFQDRIKGHPMSVDAMVKLSEAPWTCVSDGYVGMWLKMDVARLEKPLFETKRKTQNCCAVLGFSIPTPRRGCGSQWGTMRACGFKREESHLEGRGSHTSQEPTRVKLEFRPAEPKARQSIGA